MNNDFDITKANTYDFTKGNEDMKAFCKANNIFYDGN